MTRRGRWWKSPLLPALMFGGTAVVAGESPATLVLHVEFRPSDGVSAVRAIERISSRTLEVRQVVRVLPTRLGHAAEFAGHPEQGVLLGVLEIRPPVTFAVWIKRARAPTAHANGAKHPEYLQEHRDGLGRILSPLTGTPRDAGQQAGVLRLGPDGVSVWHGPTK